MINRLKKVVEQISLWQTREKKQRQFILLLSFVVGLLSGIAAVILKNTVHYTHYFITNGFHFEQQNYLYLAFPLIGILLTLLFVRYVIKDNISHGVSRILFAISKKKGKLEPHNTYSSMVSSTITVAFGGSVGLEAPIVLTGSAIGSNLGRLFGLNYRTILLMIGCGAAGAIAGIFKAPIAALVFAIEVLMLDLTMATLIPLLIAVATGSMVSFFFMGKSVLFFTEYTDPFFLSHIPAFLLLGIFTGLVSLYFTRATQGVERIMSSFKKVFPKAIMGGIALGILIFVFPSLYGEGYALLDAIMLGRQDYLINEGLFHSLKDRAWFLFAIILAIILVKVIAMAITTGSGGIGGIFAPSLFVGGLSGLFAAKILNQLTFMQVSELNFILVGMAGLMSGVMHAPLTGIFLIAEITGGYELFTPLIITATVSYLTIKYFETHSMYAKRLAERGELMTHHKDKAVLSMMAVRNLIETNFSAVDINATLGDFVKVVAKSQRNVFPVVDKDNNFYGVVFINDIREMVFNRDLYNTIYIRDLMFMPSPLVDPDETMEDVARKFSESENFNLCVIKNGKYLGFISRAQVFSTYRKMLEEFSDD